MLKLMIVDDEYLFREALKVSLPWEELGYEICCEAENGDDALEKIKQFKPDVALVDINMPIMDGLEFAAEVKESGQDVKIVIITGYGEFSYAHQAIQLGVENYLLKPVDENELANILISIKMIIEKESATKLEVENLKKQVQQYKPMLKEMILNDLLQGNSLRGKEEFLELKEYFKTDVSSSSSQVVIVEMDEKREYGWDAHDRQLWCFAVSNIAEEILQNSVDFDICRDIRNRINIIIYQNTADKELQKDVINVCERIRISVYKYLKFTVTIGIGNSYDDISNLPLSYKEAVFSLGNKLVMGENRIFSFESFSESDMKASLYPVEQRKQLLMSMRVGDIQGAEGIIHSIFGQALCSSYSGEIIVVMCVELVSTCLEFVTEMGYTIKMVLDIDFNILEFIQEKKSISELEACIKEIFSKAFDLVHGSKNKRSSRIVEEAKTYIHENYTRFDLKIDDIARHVHVKYGHLCFLFKRETGSTLNDYITEIRIKKAKELIDSGCLSVASVSSKVGYADANYFGKCFKKLYGITPGRYIDNNSNLK